ncbi:hypothetical protein ACFVRU_14535 [Streptomyces sp. NPDC057927]
MACSTSYVRRLCRERTLTSVRSVGKGAWMVAHEARQQVPPGGDGVGALALCALTFVQRPRSRRWAGRGRRG